MEHLARILLLIGIVFIIAGLILYFGWNKTGWLGHLPGDIRIEREHFRLYIPLTSMVLISVIISALLYIIRKLF